MIGGVSHHLAVACDIFVFIDALGRIIRSKVFDFIKEALVIAGDAMIFTFYVTLSFNRY